MAIIMVFVGDLYAVLILFLASLVFDLLDGLVARALNISSELGAELDSLADMVSFGLLPGVILFDLIHKMNGQDSYELWPAALGFTYTAFAALRLAKFNIDTRQSTDFLGLNTPAASIAIVGLYINANINCDGIGTFFTSNFVIMGILVFVLSILLLLDLPMLSFKFHRKDRSRLTRQVILIIGGIIIYLIMRTCALPFLILWYILFSFVNLIIEKSK